MDATSFFRRRAAVAVLCVFAFTLAAITNSAACAATIRVPADQPTIQAGIDAASAGDTVLVAAGTYTGPGNRDLDFGGNDLVLMSEGGRSVTTIDPQDAGRGILFQSGETAAAVVEGFTIRNGLADGTYGGGILIEGGATPTIRDCRLESNQGNSGGGIYVWESGATLVGCEFEANTANNYGGGIYGGDSSLEMTGCALAQNQAGIGAGMYVILGTTAVLSDCSFTENAPLNLAGGIYGLDVHLTLERCSFVRNTGNVGAGVYLEEGTASVDSCTFSLNTADYGGGGMYAASVNALTVTGCRFEGNVALSTGATLPIGGGGLSASGGTVAPYIADCTFVGNRAIGPNPNSGSGGGLSGAATIERCVFTDNHANRNGGGARVGGQVRECVFDGNTAGNGASGGGGGVAGAQELIDCRFVNNRASGIGGGAWGARVVVRCEFSGNASGSNGGGFYTSGLSIFTIENSQFTDNSASQGGGLRLFVYPGYPASVTACTFARNTAYMGGAASVAYWEGEPPPVTFSMCAMVGNGASAGGGMSVAIPVEIENTIIAFGTEGGAVTCDGIVGIMSCTDIYGNEGGDWTGCIADQLGIQGNFSADPLFCNVGGGDYTLAETSPCAPEHSPAGCGLIGAFPVACVNPIGVAGEAAPPVAGGLTVIPNPVRSGATFTSDDGMESPALEIYDPNGRLIDLLRPSGHSATWLPGKDARSGVYFARLRGAGGTRVVKFLVLR